MRPTPSVLGSGIGESQRRLLGLIKRSGECTLAQLEAGFDLDLPALVEAALDLAAMFIMKRELKHLKVFSGTV